MICYWPSPAQSFSVSGSVHDSIFCTFPEHLHIWNGACSSTRGGVLLLQQLQCDLACSMSKCYVSNLHQNVVVQVLVYAKLCQVTVGAAKREGRIHQKQSDYELFPCCSLFRHCSILVCHRSLVDEIALSRQHVTASSVFIFCGLHLILHLAAYRVRNLGFIFSVAITFLQQMSSH